MERRRFAGMLAALGLPPLPLHGMLQRIGGAEIGMKAGMAGRRRGQSIAVQGESPAKQK